MSLYRVIVPFTDAKAQGPARFASIQIDADDEQDAKNKAIVEFKEMAGLTHKDAQLQVLASNIRVERAPAAKAATLSMTAKLVGPKVASAKLIGSVSSSNYQVMRNGFDKLKAKGIVRLVLDLSELVYINSTGMSLFVAAGDLFDLRMASVPPRITRLLAMVGLDQVFEFYLSVDDAAKASS